MVVDFKGDGYIFIFKMKFIIDNCVLFVLEDYFKRLVSMGFVSGVFECLV